MGKSGSPPSHPLWVCGLKLKETVPTGQTITSHPLWVCGLKYTIYTCHWILPDVTPFMGVWIEIVIEREANHFAAVTPFMGVWIEIILDASE